MKLSEIQQKLKAPKSQLNKFGGYKYRNCEDILETLKPLLGASTLTLSDEVVCVGNRNYVKATAKIQTYNEGFNSPFETTEVTAYACEASERKGMDSSQITGAASSYARKYALNGLFLIDDTKDADSDENASESPKTAPTAKQTPEAGKEQFMAETEIQEVQKGQIKDLMKSLKEPTTKQNVMKLTGLEMVPENYKAIIEKLRTKSEAIDPLSDMLNND